MAPDLPLSLGVLGESKTYLTNPDFDDAEKHLKKYYKEIFENELEGIWLDENDWPQKRDYKTFCEFYKDTVVALINDQLNKIEVPIGVYAIFKNTVVKSEDYIMKHHYNIYCSEVEQGNQ